MKNVLVPTDFSAHSQNVLAYTMAHLQKAKTPCRLLLLNSYLVPSTEPSQVISLNDKMKSHSLAGLQNELDKIKKQNQNDLITCETISIMGSLENIISYIIKDQNIDCVVVGTNMLTSQSDLSLTSARRLLTRSQCPVLIVPVPVPTNSINSITITGDAVTDSTEAIQAVEKFMIGQNYQILPSPNSNHADLLVFSGNSTTFIKTFGTQTKESLKVPVLFMSDGKSCGT